MRYSITARVIDIRESTAIMPENSYGGWLAVNTGTAPAKVLGYTLQQGEGLNFLDAVPAGSEWMTPIEIDLQPGAIIRLTRLQAKEIG